jgi:hypothetical protein
MFNFIHLVFKEKDMSRRRYAKVKVTYEMIKALLGISDDIELDSVVNVPSRRLIDFYISSNNTDEPRLIRTLSHAEGQEIVQEVLTIDNAVERMRQIVHEWDEQHESESAQAQSREAMNTLYEQMSNNRE